MSSFLASCSVTDFPQNDPAGTTYHTDPLHVYWKGSDDERRWGPASDAQQGRHALLIGRIALEPEQWAEAEQLPFAGGLACRWILNLWQQPSPEQWATQLNGNFAVLLWQADGDELIVITDRCGATPIYCTTPNQPWLLGTEADRIAQHIKALGARVTLDKITLADALIHGAATAPFTYYQEIQELEPASVYRFELPSGLSRQSRYWQPKLTRESHKENDHELAAELAEAMRRAVKRRSFGKTGLLLSGGADSRAILFASETPATIETATFYDQPNPELDIAQRLAQAAGSPHLALQRPFDHYGSAIEAVVRISGGCWSIKDAHYHGFLERLQQQQWDTLLTGCYADYLLKGLALNTRYRRFFGLRGAEQELSGYQPEFYQPRVAIAPEWMQQVDARSPITPELIRDYDNNPAAVEDLRVRPLSREPDAMGRLYLQRCLPWDPIILDNDILEFYQRLTPSQKLNGKVFRMAAHLITQEKAGHIPNNNDGTALMASEAARTLKYFMSRIQVRLRNLAGKFLPGLNQPSLVTKGSWPNFSYYVTHSQLIADLWQHPTPHTQTCLTELLGYNPWQVPLSTWGSDDSKNDLFLRLLTLKVWLEQCAQDSRD